jgi:hypothetical protein
MADRSWYFASQGQQQGPYPEAQLRAFIANGTVSAETLVWTEGMADWQKAGQIPGLVSLASAPPAMSQSAGPVASAGGGPLYLDFGIWEFVWRSLLLVLGMLFVIPLPWVIVMYCRWIVSRTHVPGRPNLSFTGEAGTIAWWYFGAVVVAIVFAASGIGALRILELFIQFALYWLFIKWFVANIASDGQPLGLGFSGSYWAYVGWNILTVLSIITIIGWAWVYVAQLRWVCRHIEGTRREVIFSGTGLEFLWRSVVTAIAAIFIIPIPWVYRWWLRWAASQTVLVERRTRGAA